MSTPSASTLSVDTWLREAGAHLGQARDRLNATPRDHAGALPEVLASIHTSLLAFIDGFGGTPDPDASLAALAERAVRCDSVLKTATHRAMRFVERAPAIQRATTLSVHDREDVETGWYSARNLYHAVMGQLAESHPAAA